MGSDSSVGSENPRIPVCFNNEGIHSVYDMIRKRIKIYEIQIEQLEKKEKFQDMATKLYRIEELDFVVLHLKRNFKFKEL